MRYQYLFLLLFFAPVKMFAQTADVDITGLWKGTLYNDSTQQFYKYEIAISEEKGKLTGYSHTWFLLDDKQYYGVKKVTIKKRDGKILIEDQELIANNYPVTPAKGIYQLNVLVLDASDSLMTLKGPFATNRTKKYAPLTGTIDLQRKNDYWQSALVPHLQELNLVKNLSFVKDDILLTKNNVVVEVAKPSTVATKNTIAATNTKKLDIPEISAPTANDAIAKNITTIKSTIPAASDQQNAEHLKANKSDTVYSISRNESMVKTEKKEANPVAVNIPANSTVKETATNSTAKTSPKENNTIASHISFPKNIAAADVTKRTTLLQQTVMFKSDSLQISLYDNGEVDGDTVSVLMNGEIIMAKERLSTNAVRKTIFIPQNMDTVQLVMYAENLGLIPPNTGLLVVKDGKDLYEIRFSGDLQKNAAIIFKRKKE